MSIKKNTFLSLSWAHWVVVIVSILLTLVVWLFTSHQTKQLNQNKFNRESKQVVNLIKERMSRYVDALNSSVAHMTVLGKNANHQNWRKFANNLKLANKYPGINGIGVIYVVKRPSANKFLEKQAYEGNPLKIYPQHARELLLPITYIEPIETNRKALGLDVAHEENRYNGALRAAETGLPTISGPIVLVQDKKKTPGFLLYVPLYQTKHKQTKKLIGYVYAPFIAYKLMDGVLAKELRYVHINITDQGKTIFADTETHLLTSAPRFHTVKLIEMYGRQWLISIYPTKQFLKSIDTNLPSYILIAGIIIDIALILLFVTITRSRARAIEYAKTLTKDLHTQANEDFLTSLPNRMAFMNKLEQSLKKPSNDYFSVLYLDLDDFKNINDTLGHPIGDQLLSQIAQRLQKLLKTLLPEDHIVARLGGDEFAIFLLTKHAESKDLELASNIINEMNEPFEIEQNTLYIKFSIGIANQSSLTVKSNTPSQKVESLLKHTDIAMYEAKKHGKNQFVLFDESLNEKAKKRHLIELKLQNAIDNEHFHMVYQGLYQGTSLEKIGVEALIRWNDSELGSVGPMEFIPAAEKSGLIINLGYLIFKMVFQDMNNWTQSSKNNHYEFVTINCSTKQFEDKQFEAKLLSLMTEYKIKPSQIVLEVTETAVMKDIRSTVKTLNSLHKKGIRFAIDDFGTGYSSLNYLEELPVDFLKIDRSFTKKIENKKMNMIDNIIKISHASHIKVIAEGVETQTQLDYLQKADCDYLQGFYFHEDLK